MPFGVRNCGDPEKNWTQSHLQGTLVTARAISGSHLDGETLGTQDQTKGQETGNAAEASFLKSTEWGPKRNLKDVRGVTG